MRPVIGAWRWPRWAWAFRRRRAPLARLWDAEFNYVGTIADGGICETWPAYGRRLGLALVGRRPPVRRVEQGLTDPVGAPLTMTIDL